MKKLVLGAVAIAAIGLTPIIAPSAAHAADGDCGASSFWSPDGNGVISGRKITCNPQGKNWRFGVECRASGGGEYWAWSGLHTQQWSYTTAYASCRSRPDSLLRWKAERL